MVESMESCPSTPESLRSPVFIVYIYSSKGKCTRGPEAISTQYKKSILNFGQGKGHLNQIQCRVHVRYAYICSIAVDTQKKRKPTRQAKPTASVYANQILSVEWARGLWYPVHRISSHYPHFSRYPVRRSNTRDVRPFFPLSSPSWSLMLQTQACF